MSGPFPILRNIPGMLLLLLSASAGAGPVAATVQASGTATVLKSLSVLKQADLDFGNLAVAGSGSVAIDPANSGLTINGPLTPLGSGAHRATFTATGSKNSVVLIRLPKTPATLKRVGGNETMTVSNWTLDGTTNRKIPPGNAFTFGVGGTLNVAVGQADGTYIGTFAVTVQYP
jgi:uncharacterized protein DUF4402